MEPTAGGYQVDLGIFQGPLDLLLHLIEKEELDITRVALAQVTDQYLDHIARMPRRDPAELSAFLVVAVKLLWIKAQALLPRPPSSEPEEEDDGEALLRQLQEYRRYKQAAQQLRTWMEEGRQEFGRLALSA
ncbi:MAG: segregation and condensation protein A, partial [Chloroflexia bacterium]